MEPKHGFEKNPGFFRDLIQFLSENRKWWMVPIVVVVLLMSVFALLSATSAAPFIYTLF